MKNKISEDMKKQQIRSLCDSLDFFSSKFHRTEAQIV